MPAPRVAAQAAGLPLVPEVVALDARELHAIPGPDERPAEATRRAPAPGRLSALFDRAAGRLAAQAHMVPAQPLVLRWA